MSELISSQVTLPWSKVTNLAIKGLRKRFMRSVITMTSVILAIAFLVSILVGNNINKGLKEVRGEHPEVISLLLKNGVDLTSSNISSKMKWLIGLSLMTCSVGIVNAMLMSVTERFKEIGTMKCLGAMDGFIIKLFMIEALIQGAFGTLAGILIGLLIGLGGSRITYGSIAISSVNLVDVFSSCVISLVIGVTLCALFAIYPAYVASTMQPVEAMRSEE